MSMSTTINRIISKADFEGMDTLNITTDALDYAQLRWFPDLLYIFEPTALNTALHQYDKNFIETLPTNLGITCFAQPLFDARYLYQCVGEEIPTLLDRFINYERYAYAVSREQFLSATGFRMNPQATTEWPFLYNTETGEVDSNYKFIVPTDEQLGKNLLDQYELAEGLAFDTALPGGYSYPMGATSSILEGFWRWLQLSYDTNLITFSIPIGNNDVNFPPADPDAKYMIPKLFIPYMTAFSSNNISQAFPVIYWFGIKEIN